MDICNYVRANQVNRRKQKSIKKVGELEFQEMRKQKILSQQTD